MIYYLEEMQKDTFIFSILWQPNISKILKQIGFSQAHPIGELNGVEMIYRFGWLEDARSYIIRGGWVICLQHDKN